MCDSKATLQSSLNTYKEAFHEKIKYYCKMHDNQSGGKHDLDESFLAFNFHSFPSFSIFRYFLAQDKLFVATEDGKKL